MNSAPDLEEDSAEAVDPELVLAVETILADVEKTGTWTFATFMGLAGRFEGAAADVERTLDTADSYGTILEPSTVEHLLETLDVIGEKLLAAEQDGNLAVETARVARQQHPYQDGDDDIVTIGVRVTPLLSRRPQTNVTTLLLRQFVGKQFDWRHRIVSVPRWFVRRVERLSPIAGVWIAEIVEDVPTGEILEIANGLWEPRHEGVYQSPLAVLDAARFLET
jgi:hypothetical protein